MNIRQDALEASVLNGLRTPLLHPSMAEVYRQRISALHERLQDENERSEAAAVFRTLVDQVPLQPEEERTGHRIQGVIWRPF